MLVVLLNGCWDHFEKFGALISGGRNYINRVRIVWFSYIWSIWKAQNTSIFKNKNTPVEQLLEVAQRLSWNWLYTKTKSVASMVLDLRLILG